ncbi:hypothetical protein IWX90DRAFT_303004 [Phyllosticta citrichinensis]|uniref:Uncharacterized protein n=1 Tax=Phyllosticta citrichinensis TaxID=1130410 RepID=A0ABR1XLL4_9PEZI
MSETAIETDNSDEGAFDSHRERAMPDSDADKLSVARKRKRRVDAGTNSRAKRYRKLYHHGYRELYNSDIAQVVDFVALGQPGRLKPSQIGASHWTITEKQRLFTAIERFGRDRMQALTSAVETKSEAQIQEYLLLLEQGMVEVFLNQGIDYQPPRPHEIPAAYELSDDCCNKLDETASALSWYQHSFEAKQEQERHGKFWLLTSTLADQIDEAFKKAAKKQKGKKDTRWSRYKAYEDEDDSDQEVDEELGDDEKVLLESVPAASFLDLSNWIRLSDNVFMNAGGDRAEENWRSIAEEGDEPGIFHTAFSDFHRLAVSITKRLVLVALNQAESRLRATERNYKHAPEPSVSSSDVYTALDMLNMPRTAKETWIKIPERCGVVVWQTSRDRKGRHQPLDYDEVERMLGGKPPPRRPERNADDVVEEEELSEDEIASQDQHTGDESDDSDDDGAAIEQDQYETRMEAYAEEFDICQSQVEEARILKAIGLPAPVKQAILTDPPKRRKFATGLEDLVDWREHVDHKSAWERYGRPISETDFARVQHALVYEEAESEENPEPAQLELKSDAPGIDDAHSEKEELAQEEEPAQEEPTEEVAVRPGRVFEPRQARTEATSNMGELPPYPEGNGDVLSEDGEYDEHNQ